jgi:hypothetical protein
MQLRTIALATGVALYVFPCVIIGFVQAFLHRPELATVFAVLRGLAPFPALFVTVYLARQHKMQHALAIVLLSRWIIFLGYELTAGRLPAAVPVSQLIFGWGTLSGTLLDTALAFAAVHIDARMRKQDAYAVINSTGPDSTFGTPDDI